MVNENIAIDGHKIAWHKDRLKQWHEKGDCPPIYVEIGLTNLCNHDCVFCGFDYARGTDTLDTKVLLDNVKIMGNYGVKSILYSGAGEPFLNKDFPQIIRKTKGYGIDVAFSTNIALFNKLNAEKVLPYTSWIRLSLDSATPETHAKVHRAKGQNREKDFSKILLNLENLVKIKRANNYGTTLGTQFLLLEENAHEVLESAKLCRDLGLDLFQVKPYSKHPPSINELSVDYNKFKELEDELKNMSTDTFKVVFRSTRMQRIKKERDYNQCLSLSFWAMINERGDVVPCDLFYDVKEYFYGNIYENNFKEIWESKKRQEVLQKIKGRGVNNCKEGCRGDLINSFLFKIKQGKIKIEEIKTKGEPSNHINFI